ncbi:hypothetical protein L1887_52750 [Cichorium endivia]|nr:hypothetical protein L1887_52750 [Cichorium endivia]
MSHPALTQLRALRYFDQIPALDPQQLDWLLLEDSMTKRFEQQGKTVTVTLIQEGFVSGDEIASELPLLPQEPRYWLREILLCADGEPWLAGRTVVPESTLSGPELALQRLGKTPLGRYLFTSSELTRDFIEIGRDAELWGRRSRLRLSEEEKMEWSLTQNKLLAYHRLMRTDKPIGALLLLWPTLWALWLATPGVPPLWILGVFVAGVWLMRAAGCVVNDYADRKFDGHVKRTAGRPLPSGQVTGKEARVLFIVLVLLSFLLVLTLNTMTILLSVAALALAWVYPFMKRYTHLPQVVLGAAFGWSIPMAFAAVSESLPLSCWLMFLANILWAVAYDTQYAMVDRDDDLKIGIKSTAILFGRQDKLIIGILQVAVLALMVAIGRLNGLNWEFYWSVLVAGLLFAYQQKLIAKRERDACFKAFMNNNYVGLVLFLGLAMSYFL